MGQVSALHLERLGSKAQGLTKTDLEEDLDAHRQHAIDDPEGKDERHRVDVQTQEPSDDQSESVRASRNDSRQGSDRKLDVDRSKVILDHRQAALDERLEYTLVEQRSLHRRAAR